MTDPATLMRDMFGGFAGDGWQGLDVDPKRLEQQVREQLAQTIDEAQGSGVGVLDTPQGRRLLWWLATKTVLRPPTPEEQMVKTAEHAAILKGRRDGANGVFWMLLHALQVSRGVPQATTKE